MSLLGRSQRGQALALFTIALAAITLGAAVVVDGGYGFAQRRNAQNAADFAAMAGTRIVGISLTGTPIGTGTASNVENAVRAALTANDAKLVSAQYVDEAGAVTGNLVGATSIPSGTFGVVVEARVDWQPFLLGSIGVTDWLATATATAKTDGTETGNGVVPVGISRDAYEALPDCPTDDFDACVSERVGSLTTGHLDGPGQFGWLSFGLTSGGGKCDWAYSLGMDEGGCEVNQPFLDYQLGPPPQSFDCCDPIDDPQGGPDLIHGLTGNTWGDLSEYIDNRMVVWTPIWDTIQDTGANAAYHIVGFGAIAFTGSGDGVHAKNLEGIAVRGLCKSGEEITGDPSDPNDDQSYCTGPGDSFTIGVTGEVKLVH